jgi:hypothetical protein
MAASALACAGGIVIAADPRAGSYAIAVATCAIAAFFIPTRYIVGALLVYLSIQDLVVSRVPSSLVLPARYFPELVVFAIAVPLVLTRLPTTRREAHLLTAVAGVAILWTLTGFWNDIELSTIAAGARSEFRFLPLVLVGMLSNRVRDDARFYARVLLAAGVAQALIALLEAFGGNQIRAIFAPDYTLVVGGTVVGRLSPPLETIFGTFSHRNLLGAFLAFAAIVVAAAGSEGLGVRRRTVVLSWLVLAAGALAAVSREGVLALVIGTAFVLSFQHRLPAVRVLLVITAVSVFAVIAIRPLDDSAPPTGLSSWSRWGDVISARGWSATASGNFRLYYLLETARIVTREKPVTGFGLGTASDPRLVRSGSSPLEQYPAGQLAVQHDFYNDGNWTVVLFETGIAGIVALSALLILLGWYGYRVASAGAWVGAALAGLTIATAVLGFFAPILQTRTGNFILWLFAGLAVGSMAARSLPPRAIPPGLRWGRTAD